jgi:hypothetical protein
MKLLLGSTALAIALGLGAYPAGPAAAQQIQYACDENGDGFVDATESRLCTEREFDEIAAGEQALTEEQLSALSEGQEGMPAFAEFLRTAMARSAARNGAPSPSAASPARPRRAAVG